MKQTQQTLPVEHSDSPGKGPVADAVGSAVEQDAATVPSPTSVCCPGIERYFDTGLFRALGDANRNALLVELARQGKPVTVSELSTCCDVDLSVVSRHLKVLRDAGLLESKKKGKHVYYSARLVDVAHKLKQLADALVDAAEAGSTRVKRNSR
jgi:ArsR family transcriptional regulator